MQHCLASPLLVRLLLPLRALLLLPLLLLAFLLPALLLLAVGPLPTVQESHWPDLSLLLLALL